MLTSAIFRGNVSSHLVVPPPRRRTPPLVGGHVSLNGWSLSGSARLHDAKIFFAQEENTLAQHDGEARVYAALR